jgi:hypothetical protein
VRWTVDGWSAEDSAAEGNRIKLDIAVARSNGNASFGTFENAVLSAANRFNMNLSVLADDGALLRLREIALRGKKRKQNFLMTGEVFCGGCATDSVTYRLDEGIG